MQTPEVNTYVPIAEVKKNEMQILTWDEAWRNKSFRIKTIVGGMLLVMLLALFPLFFSYVEKRQGIQLNDFILQQIPVADVSMITFIIIWSVSILLLIRCVQRADIFLVMLWSFLFFMPCTCAHYYIGAIVATGGTDRFERPAHQYFLWRCR